MLFSLRIRKVTLKCSKVVMIQVKHAKFKSKSIEKVVVFAPVYNVCVASFHGMSIRGNGICLAYLPPFLQTSKLKREMKANKKNRG